MANTINILGTRGVPAKHGGFETFAENLSRFLVERDWEVNVYCQEEAAISEKKISKSFSVWKGVGRITIHIAGSTTFSTLLFDLKSTLDACGRGGVDLVLGYNTAFLLLFNKMARKRTIINMDGVEWRRDKWSLPLKIWFYINEFLGIHLADIIIADHPEIAKHLRRHGSKKMHVIPYASDSIFAADSAPLAEYGLTSGRYITSIARIEPENSILEIVRAFSARPRGIQLMVLGNLDVSKRYHAEILRSASAEVVFPGAIYDRGVLTALRFHALAYVHGHQVGGTNPSLVEALGAGNAIIAHDNVFNRWVAGDNQFFFRDEGELRELFSAVIMQDERLVNARHASRRRHAEEFTWDKVHSLYEQLFLNAVKR